MTARKKLIEVALPLEAINRESAREKSIRHGHPSTLHMWWARRPLAACRAVLFASIVDDPSIRQDEFPTPELQQAERERLFGIIEELVKWENSSNERVLQSAWEEISKATGGHPPQLLDPFCGGGSIPLEGQRLGLTVHASDLNPVAVLITKALIEIPPKFMGLGPVNPVSRAKMSLAGAWQGAYGLAEDVRYYGKWLRDQAERRIGHLYPKVQLPKEYGGGEATVIAWLWARTVPCPNPACRARMPLVRSFWLSTKPTKKAWVTPVVDAAKKTVTFGVEMGDGGARAGTVGRRGAECIVCSTPVPFDYVRSEGKAGRMSSQLMAIVAEGRRGRIYLAPNEFQEAVARSAAPERVPDSDLPEVALGFRVQLYGMTKHRDLFTPRQLTAMTTFSDLVTDAREKVLQDAEAAGRPGGTKHLFENGDGALAYADAIATYLGLSASKSADYNSTICSWMPGIKYEVVGHAFTRQAIPMTWDFAESNPLAGSSGDYLAQVLRSAKVLELGLPPRSTVGRARQLDATAHVDGVDSPLICTDPPYYSNIGYADLSDFFYVWLRRALGPVFPDLFSTLLTPKEKELVASPFRFRGNKKDAESFFEHGLAESFERMRALQNPDFPLTMFYAFKQAEETAEDGDLATVLASTGWETMLNGLLDAGFMVTGTWPMHTERAVRSVGQGTNALASSIVLVCWPRPASATLATRREFVAALKAELPDALKKLQQGNIAPVDLAQASIGPGMAVFSRFAKVLEADGSAMRVRAALGLINQLLDEALTEQDSEYDAATRWALAWFEQHGLEEGKFGDAETLSKAKNVAVTGLVEDGFLWSRRGKVRLLSRDELDEKWDPTLDQRVTVWEVTQHLVRLLDKEGEAAASGLLRRLGSLGEVARDLAYRLYSTSERKGWAREAVAYNSLVVAWPQIVRLASGSPQSQPEQTALLTEA